MNSNGLKIMGDRNYLIHTPRLPSSSSEYCKSFRKPPKNFTFLSSLFFNYFSFNVLQAWHILTHMYILTKHKKEIKTEMPKHMNTRENPFSPTFLPCT